MTPDELDERAHRTALLALIPEALPVFDYGMAPGDINSPVAAVREATPLPIFALLALERRYTSDGGRLSGRPSRSGWRALFRHTGRTVDEARWARRQITEAMRDIRVTVAGELSTPIEFESDTEIAVDEGMFSGETVWTYAL